jgi:TldD protein
MTRRPGHAAPVAFSRGLTGTRLAPRVRGAYILALLCLAAAPLPAQDDDVLLRAMHDEMERIPELRVVGGSDPLYLLKYSLDDVENFVATASLGGLLSTSGGRVRVFRVGARVGDYVFDNTNYVFSELPSGAHFESGTLPLDDDYRAIRQEIWLATDASFKTALDAIGHKRSALQNVNVTDALADYTKAPPVRRIEPVAHIPFDPAAWTARTVALSAIFADYPQVLGSNVESEFINSTSYMVSSEGTALRRPDHLMFVNVRAWGQAGDGMVVRDGAVSEAFDPSKMPSELDLRRTVADVASTVTSLAAARRGEDFSGPMLFEPRAAAQLFAAVLVDNLKLTRKPVPQPGRPVPWSPSELEGRLGSRIMPEWMDVVNDPTQTEWHGNTLLGHYDLDDEGVAAQPVVVVDKGVLKGFLLTRTPVRKGLEASNGSARLPGPYGASAAGLGNLFIHSSTTAPLAELKKKLIALCQERQKPYGILVREIDFPTSANAEDLQQMLAAMVRSGGGTRPVPPPVQVFRVYPDGREELIRGVRFRGVSTRSFRDIVGASDESAVFNYLDNNAPFAMMGAGGYVNDSTVVSPGVLFDEMELEPVEEEEPRIPLVPRPPMEAAR